jgi:hypothetical protein
LNSNDSIKQIKINSLHAAYVEKDRHSPKLADGTVPKVFEKIT